MGRLGGLVAILLALLYAALLATIGTPTLTDDSLDYYTYATNLLDTGTYGASPGVPDMKREPGYSVFLAMILAGLRAANAIGTRIHPEMEVAPLRWLVFWQASFFVACLVAFWRMTSLRETLKGAFVAICVLSPTFLGVHSVIYSESLAVSLIVLLLGIVTSRRYSSHSVRAPIAVGVLLGVLCLTKTYLRFLVYGFALVLLIEWIVGRVTRGSGRDYVRGALIWVSAMAIVGIWNVRNYQLGDERNEMRMTIQLTSKILRVHTWDWPSEFPIAVSASLGSNFCDQRYGPALCRKYDFRIIDDVGYGAWAEAVRGSPNLRAAERSLLLRLGPEWIRTAGLQIIGSGLEIVRMMVYEFVPLPLGASHWVVVMAKAWRPLGSAVGWVLATLGLGYYFKGRFVGERNGAMRAAIWWSIGLFSYHAAIMSQIINVQRYMAVVMPLIYLTASIGLHGLIQGSETGTRRRPASAEGSSFSPSDRSVQLTPRP